MNIGVEPSKGTGLQKETYLLLEEADRSGGLNLVGNVEAREAVEGTVDVIVADGYAGNIFLKTVEGAGKLLGRQMKGMFKKNLLTKLAAVLVKDGIREFKALMDADAVGGTALIGISKPVIKAHGSSNEVAIQNAIRQGFTLAQSGLIDDITAHVGYMSMKREKMCGESVEKS